MSRRLSDSERTDLAEKGRIFREMEDRLIALQETNARLNRRAQIAEAAINELVNGTGHGKAKPVAAEVWQRCVETHGKHCPALATHAAK